MPSAGDYKAAEDILGGLLKIQDRGLAAFELLYGIPLRGTPSVTAPRPPHINYRVNHGDLRHLRHAFATLEKSLQKELRKEIRKAAEPIKQGAAARFLVVDPRSARKYGISVRKTGVVSVEQRLRKSAVVARRRHNFGGLQMRRALVPALQDNQAEVVEHVNTAVAKALREAGF